MLERLRSNQDYQLAVIENGPLQSDSDQKRGKTRQSQERQEENRSTAPGRDVGHLTTRTPPRTAEQRQRKGKETKDWRKTRREEEHSTRSAHLTTCTLPWTAEHRQAKRREERMRKRKGKGSGHKCNNYYASLSRIIGKQAILKGQAVVTEDATTLLQRSAVLIGNGPLQMLQRLRCNQDYQQW